MCFVVCFVGCLFDFQVVFELALDFVKVKRMMMILIKYDYLALVDGECLYVQVHKVFVNVMLSWPSRYPQSCCEARTVWINDRLDVEKSVTLILVFQNFYCIETN